MFNTLKEMQETIPYKDLCKYANMSLGKSPEEIKALLKSYGVEVSNIAANECYELIKDINVVSDEELDNVAGGSCYSKSTYDSLGISVDGIHGQKGSYHPLITTIGNSCKLHSNFDGSACHGCTWVNKPSGTMTYYCEARSQEHDPGRDY